MGVEPYGDDSLKEVLKSMTDSYHDFVIKNGEFIGAFEEMYKAHKDPWHQSDHLNINDPARKAIKDWIGIACRGRALKIVELGCGYGHLTSAISEIGGAQPTGIDISETAIARAKNAYPNCKFQVTQFDDWEVLNKINPDIFILADISWYVLPRLDKFISDLRVFASSRNVPTFLLHVVTTYPPSVQKYGNEYFTKHSEIIEFFGFKCLQDSEFKAHGDAQHGTKRSFAVFLVL